MRLSSFKLLIGFISPVSKEGVRTEIIPTIEDQKWAPKGLRAQAQQAIEIA
jgi:hypothetical protein